MSRHKHYERYVTYINSDAWRHKRLLCLQAHDFKCAVCGEGNRLELQVHHLTYARLFDEDLEDLLPLCKPHHEAVEDAIKRGLIPRSGDVAGLRQLTTRLALSERTTSIEVIGGLETRNEIQRLLAGQAWFTAALKLARPVFKRLCRTEFKSHPKVSKYMANCFTLYDRHHTRMKPN